MNAPGKTVYVHLSWIGDGYHSCVYRFKDIAEKMRTKNTIGIYPIVLPADFHAPFEKLEVNSADS